VTESAERRRESRPAERATSSGGELWERLLAKSSFFARSAVDAYKAEVWEVFHLHLATAVELLVKAALARLHPALIADPKAELDSLLHLLGLGRHATTRETAIRTINASAALDRVARVVDDHLKAPAAVRRVLDIRNGVVHIGEHAPTDEALLADVAQYVDGVLQSQGWDSDAYWGSSADAVAELVEGRAVALRLWYERRVEAARANLAAIVANMDEAATSAFLAAVTPPSASEPFDEWPVTCPACGNAGLANGEPDPDWEADWDVADGEAYAAGAYVSAVNLDVRSFGCRACGLVLSGPALRLAELDRVDFGESEFDVSEASEYFGRLESEAWADFDY
jgi:hypothetical protein